MTIPPIEAGDVVALDTGVLRSAGGSRTNAQVTASEDRAVTGVHDFLVLHVDRAAGQVSALPLFPRSAPGSAPLDDRLRAGPAEWLAQPVFYSRWQHWQLPLATLTSAIAGDLPARRYAAGNEEVLRELGNWASRNRCAFRPA